MPFPRYRGMVWLSILAIFCISCNSDDLRVESISAEVRQQAIRTLELLAEKDQDPAGIMALTYLTQLDYHVGSASLNMPSADSSVHYAYQRIDQADTAAILADKGTVADLPFLINLMDSPVAGDEIKAKAAFAILRIDRRKAIFLTGLDWGVIFLYGLGMVVIGWFYSKKNRTEEDYLLGGRRMNSLAVGVSLFATLLSTLTYLSYPGELIKYGPAILGGMLAFPFVYFAVGWWLIPRIMRMNVTSAYEILELKLGRKVRLFATLMFLSLRFLWMATIIYVTIDIAIFSVIPLDRSYIPMVGMVLMLITIVYTTMGGIRAVVVTDVIQACIFLGGGLLTIIVISLHFHSFTAWLPTEWPSYWRPWRWGFDMHERETAANAALMLFTWYICTNGSDQLAIQRYLATKDVKSARNSLKVALYANVVAKCLLGLVGLAVFAYFGQNPHDLADGQTMSQQADTLFPRFIALGLPIGLSGLVIAGLLAAAMSSLSSGLNSVSAVISKDVFTNIISQNDAEITRRKSLRDVQLYSLFAGVIVIVLSFFIGNVEGNLMDVIVKVVNLFVAPLFVLFFMALFISFATEWATLLGGAISVVVAVLIAFWGLWGISVFWIMPVSLVAGIGCSVVLSYMDDYLLKINK